MEGVRKKARDCMMGVSMVIDFLLSHAHRDRGSNILDTYQHPPFSFRLFSSLDFSRAARIIVFKRKNKQKKKTLIKCPREDLHIPDISCLPLFCLTYPCMSPDNSCDANPNILYKLTCLYCVWAKA